jgi:hypothetical protein
MPEAVEAVFALPAGTGDELFADPAELIAAVEAGIAEVEGAARAERARTGRRVLGRKTICEQSWRDAPTSVAPRRQRRPRFAGRTASLRVALAAYRQFLALYQRARAAWATSPKAAVLFPVGTYALAALGAGRGRATANVGSVDIILTDTLRVAPANGAAPSRRGAQCERTPLKAPMVCSLRGIAQPRRRNARYATRPRCGESPFGSAPMALHLADHGVDVLLTYKPLRGIPVRVRPSTRLREVETATFWNNLGADQLATRTTTGWDATYRYPVTKAVASTSNPPTTSSPTPRTTR